MRELSRHICQFRAFSKTNASCRNFGAVRIERRSFAQLMHFIDKNQIFSHAPAAWSHGIVRPLSLGRTSAKDGRPSVLAFAVPVMVGIKPYRKKPE